MSILLHWEIWSQHQVNSFVCSTVYSVFRKWQARAIPGGLDKTRRCHFLLEFTALLPGIHTHLYRYDYLLTWTQSEGRHLRSTDQWTSPHTEVPPLTYRTRLEPQKVPFPFTEPSLLKPILGYMDFSQEWVLSLELDRTWASQWSSPWAGPLLPFGTRQASEHHWTLRVHLPRTSGHLPSLGTAKDRGSGVLCWHLRSGQRWGQPSCSSWQHFLFCLVWAGLSRGGRGKGPRARR